MKTVIIGPLYPYKGGISHYNGRMCRSLSRISEVIPVTYSVQYPRILFKKQQKDFSNDSFKIDNANAILNTANPLSWIKTVLFIRKQKPDLVIFQWWHPYFAPCYITLCILLKNIKKLLICHNVLPHERFPCGKLLAKAAISYGDFFIVHSEFDGAELHKLKENSRYEVCVLPTLDLFEFSGVSKEDAKKQLGIMEDNKVLLFFGFVREYKGLKYLIRAMPRIIAKDSSVRLIIAGDFGDNKDEYLSLIKKSGVSNRITLICGYIPDKEVEYYFSASDIVVLPYESATQSGIVQVAYSFEKPVIVTAVGGLPDAVIDGKTGFVVPPCDPVSIADAVDRFYSSGNTELFSENIRAESRRFSWEKMNEAILRLYQS